MLIFFFFLLKSYQSGAHGTFLSPGYPQRKRRGGTVNSRQAQKRTREVASTPEMALEAEPIELVESGETARDPVTMGGWCVQCGGVGDHPHWGHSVPGTGHSPGA